MPQPKLHAAPDTLKTPRWLRRANKAAQPKLPSKGRGNAKPAPRPAGLPPLIRGIAPLLEEPILLFNEIVPDFLEHVVRNKRRRDKITQENIRVNGAQRTEVFVQHTLELVVSEGVSPAMGQ